MDWDALFDDLQGRLEAAERDEVDGQMADLVEAEVATVSVVDRWRAAAGSPVRLRLADGRTCEGAVVDCGVDWVLLRRGARQELVATRAVHWVVGLGGAAPEPGLVASRLALGHALRALARRRVDVLVHLVAGPVVRGTVARVGKDHLDLAAGGEVLTVPFGALVSVATA